MFMCEVALQQRFTDMHQWPRRYTSNGAGEPIPRGDEPVAMETSEAEAGESQPPDSTSHHAKTIELQDCITYLEGDTELGRTPLLYKTYSLLS
jgi:hypothetical protein